MTTITYEHRDPEKLRKHPLNCKIYGDMVDPEFLESCRAGIFEPLSITADDMIISGHRRNQCARIHELKSVPVVVRRDLVDPLEIEALLIRANHQREKTVDQKAREFENLKRIEGEKAAKRQAAAGGDKTKTPPKSAEKSPKSASGKIPGSAPGEAAEVAAEAVGMSRKTAEKAVEVVHRIDELKEAGETDRAEELGRTLEKSVSKAHREAIAEPEPEKPAERVDSLKRPIHKSLHAVFDIAAGFEKLAKDAHKLLDPVKELAEGDGGTFLHLQAIQTDINNVKSTLRQAMPYTTCPYCKGKRKYQGKECSGCKGGGWVNKAIYDRAPSEMKEDSR